jgi:rod shape determining protein RodA
MLSLGSLPGLILKRFFAIDWLLLMPCLLIASAGLVTMNSFVGESLFFERQVIWLIVSLIIFAILSQIDFRFLRHTAVVVSIYGVSILTLLVLFILGSAVRGSQSWFDFGFFSFEPVDLAKIALVIVLAKYFSRRHIEIANFKHIIVSGVYAFILFFLVFLQPDFGSAVILFLIWLGMVMISGISKKHLLAVFGAVVLVVLGLWFNVFEEYQKQRIITFLNPLTDLRGAGYNAYQSTIAVGSGEMFGKGIGYGTQSRLKYLPEYETDFIFAAFAEEWGFVGVLTLMFLYGLLLYRIIFNSLRGSSNFEALFGFGVAVTFMSHILINVGMNVGVMPVTGITLPFMSYGGSHLVAEFVGIGIIMGMRRYRQAIHRDAVKNEFVGPA